MRLTIKADVSGALRQLDLTQQAIRRSAVDALNRTAEQARTESVRDITGTFNLQSSFVRERIEIRKATFRGERLEAALVVQGKDRSFNLIRFAERRVSLAEGKRRRKAGRVGVYVKVKKSSGYELVPGAFIGNQGRTVFRRIDKARLPIEPLQSIGVGQAMISDVGRRKLDELVRSRFPENMRQQLRRRGVATR